MPKKFRGLSVDFLEDQRAEALKGGAVSEEEWLKKCVKVLSGLLRRDPRRYRSFGPYWQLAKEALINGGITDFGESLDAEWLEKTRYATPFLGLLAGVLYSGHAMEMGLIYSNSHNVEFINEDGAVEDDVYVVADDDMEALAIEKSGRF